MLGADSGLRDMAVIEEREEKAIDKWPSSPLTPLFGHIPQQMPASEAAKVSERGGIRT